MERVPDAKELQTYLDRVLLDAAQKSSVTGFYLMRLTVEDDGRFKDGVFLDVSSDFAGMLGYYKHELVGKKSSEITYRGWSSDEEKQRRADYDKRVMMRAEWQVGGGLTIDDVKEGGFRDLFKSWRSKHGREIKTRVLGASLYDDKMGVYATCWVERIKEYPHAARYPSNVVEFNP